MNARTGNNITTQNALTQQHGNITIQTKTTHTKINLFFLTCTQENTTQKQNMRKETQQKHTHDNTRQQTKPKTTLINDNKKHIHMTNNIYMYTYKNRNNYFETTYNKKPHTNTHTTN